MSTTQKNKLANVFTLLVLLLTTFQGLIPTMPITNVTVISAVTMFLVTGLTAWKQYVSAEIDNASMQASFFMAMVATLGALLELFNVLPFNDTTAQWLRFGITLITAFINLASKILWPTEDTKSQL
jgi:hypothetical protein